MLLSGCAGSPTTGIKPYSWDDPYWKAENYESKDPESVLLTEGGPKNKEEAFSLMRSRLAEFGADAVIKVQEKKNKNFEGIVVLFD
mgnify:FL=1